MYIYILHIYKSKQQHNSHLEETYAASVKAKTFIHVSNLSTFRRGDIALVYLNSYSTGGDPFVFC